MKKTIKQRQLMKLENERPDLLERVKNKEITANAAMIEAGFITPRIKASKNPDSVVEMIKKHRVTQLSRMSLVVVQA